MRAEKVVEKSKNCISGDKRIIVGVAINSDNGQQRIQILRVVSLGFLLFEEKCTSQSSRFLLENMERERRKSKVIVTTP